MEREQREAAVIDLDLEMVNLPITVDDRPCHADIAVDEGTNRQPEPLLHESTHRRKALFQTIQLFQEMSSGSRGFVHDFGSQGSSLRTDAKLAAKGKKA